ncbi:MAG: tripartite tricarboxylate transporter substrate binding protein [Rhodospirillales bacterium]
MTYHPTRLFGLGLAALAFSFSPSFIPAAHAADWPAKPIEFIIPFGAGGGADIEGRLLAKEMGKILGIQFVPINKPGAGGAKTYTYLKNAKPDGYTVAWSSTSVLTATNIGNVPFKHDAMDHIGQVEFQPLPFAVKGNAKWKTFKDFVADCRKNPGKLKIANSGTGSATHLGALALMNAAKCKVIHLPVGVKRRNATVLSGEADAMVAPLTAAVRLAKAKKIRLLAIPADSRNRVIPDVPTAKELGYKATVHFFRSLSVPKGTPADVQQKLVRAMIAAAESKPFRALSKKAGFTIEPLTGDRFDKMLRAEDKNVIGIMKSAGLLGAKSKKK